MIPRFLLALLLLVQAVSACAQQADDSHAADIEQMLVLARQAQLAQRAEWHKINLYHVRFGGWKSHVDDPSYFLSPDGAHDPAAELEATIRGAFDDSMANNSRQPNVCRWIARYGFLSRSMRALGFTYELPRCEGFERWKSGIATHRATLVFASVYLNSPASMYGHAFIRFDSETPGQYNRLNDATVGYFVQGQDGNGAMFLLRSLFGGYPGAFGFVPYYVKVREYADLENRDLWEYQTDLRSEEIERMLAFIWEQSFTYMDYYFFDDNCALMLLASFEAARPELDLIEQAKPWYIPLDMLKLVLQQPGLVASSHYRPSQYNTLLHNYDLATEAEQAQALALSEGRTEMPPGREQARILDLSLGMLEYQRNQKHTQQEIEVITERQLRLAGVRSKIEAESQYKVMPPPVQRPDQGHGSFRVGLAAGQAGGASYAQLNLRGGYHDGLDPQSGFAQGASSKIGDLYLRLNADQIRFERLDLFDVFAPAVQTAWVQPTTLKINISLRREMLRDDAQEPTALRVQVGVGKTYRMGTDARAYILADSVSSLGEASSVAVGPSAGVIWAVTPGVRSEAVANTHCNVAGERRGGCMYRLSAALAWDVFDNQNNMRLNVARQAVNDGADATRAFTDVQLAYFHYF